mmetsp:Transcript_26704/g.43226  ORF Transcript_26704/g.43226 Transcript_26704/m.43226 type:complete len:172 (+) Transcript_26704:227-742(+)
MKKLASELDASKLPHPGAVLAHSLSVPIRVIKHICVVDLKVFPNSTLGASYLDVLLPFLGEQVFSNKGPAKQLLVLNRNEDNGAHLEESRSRSSTSPPHIVDHASSSSSSSSSRSRFNTPLIHLQEMICHTIQVELLRQFFGPLFPLGVGVLVTAAAAAAIFELLGLRCIR